MPHREQKKYAMKIAGIFACFAILIIGTSIIYREQSLELVVVIHSLQVSFFGAVIFGVIGFFAGQVLEKSDPELAETRESHKEDLIIKNTVISDLDFNEDEEEDANE